ncbi:MAG: ATP-binding protein [Syntrophobacteraceae bacterium]
MLLRALERSGLKRSLLFNNMQFKLMVLISIFTLAPLCVFGLFAVQMAEGLILSMATNQIEHVLLDKATLLERWISERKADVEVIAGSSILKSMNREQIVTFLVLVRSKYQVYREIMLVSNDGRIISSSSGDASELEIEERVLKSRISGLSISDIYLNPWQGESRFRISAPVESNSGGVLGGVHASVGTGAILSAVLRVSLGKTGECYLVNREGTFLAHKEPKRILTENIAQSESFKNIFESANFRKSYTDYRGIEVIGASMMISGTDWALVVEQDKDEAFEAADKLRRYVYAVILVSIIGTLGSAWLLAKYLTNPIRKLSNAANHLAGGAFKSVQFETSRTDEIGTLYEAFGDMARQLRDRHLRLEAQVTQRETELRQTDEKLQQTQRAAARSQQLASLGQLAAGVAHEIRSPLTSLKMFLESIETEVDVSRECEEDFHVAMRQVGRMESTINQFLNFARPQDPIFSQFEVRELIEDSLLVAKPRAAQQETAIEAAVGESLPMISGDRKQLGEALLNLIINGLDAIISHGHIEITAQRDTLISLDKPAECIRIDVRDSGPGIDKEIFPHIFDPFYTSKATGTGLGLSIVHGTIARHGGEVRVETSAGLGSTFSLMIPMQPGRTDQHEYGTDS